MELLNAGYDVVVVDNLSNSCEESLERVKKITGKDLKFYEADILDKEALNTIFDNESIEAVIHFAGLKADVYKRQPTAYKMIYDYLDSHSDDDKYRYTMVGYVLENTLTDNGHVARGVCETDENHYLTGITERTHIEKKEDGAYYTEDDGQTWHEIPEGSTVSMNLWGFSESILKELDPRFSKFLDENLEKNPLKCEYFLPTVVNELLDENKATVEVLKSMDKWYGVTSVSYTHLDRVAPHNVYMTGEQIVHAIGRFGADTALPENYESRLNFFTKDTVPSDGENAEKVKIPTSSDAQLEYCLLYTSNRRGNFHEGDKKGSSAFAVSAYVCRSFYRLCSLCGQCQRLLRGSSGHCRRPA